LAKTEWRAERWKKRAEVASYSADPVVLASAAQDELNSTVLADDVPDASKATRDAWKERMKRTTFLVTKAQPTSLTDYSYTGWGDNVKHLDVLEKACLARQPSYGKFSNLANDFETVSALRRAGGQETIREWLARTHPDARASLEHFPRSTPLSFRFDWIFGKLSVPVGEIHPLAARFVFADAIWRVNPRKRH